MSRIAQLLQVMERLRDPRRGCPWDVEQRFETIAPYTIEEAYEVADAIARGAYGELKDELGDLLFQVVFHAQMAREAGHFDFDTVVGAIVDKLVRRHPHVFGDAEVGSAEEQTRAWEAHKAAERRAAGKAIESALDPVTRGLPALKRAQKLQARAAREGYDWEGPAGVIAKLREELDELEQALERTPQSAPEELGDLLFTCVNLARHVQCDADGALRAASVKFERRFRRVEALLAGQGRQMHECGPAELDRLWEQVKAEGL